LATEFSPLAQNENSKKERTIYRKPAIAFDSGYLQVINLFTKISTSDFIPFLIITKTAKKPNAVIPIPSKSDKLEIVSVKLRTNIDAIKEESKINFP
jgi:hypothetical protein